MAILLVAYDLHKKKESEYQDFHNIIEKNPFTKLSESSYAIETQETPVAVYEKLRPCVDDADKFYIVTLIQPFYGFGEKAVNQWLTEKLPPPQNYSPWK